MSSRRGAGYRSIIAQHLVLMLYGPWGVNDPRGSGSSEFIDPKFEELGPIHRGRKPNHLQPSRDELREYHRDHEELLNFPVFWMDEATPGQASHWRGVWRGRTSKKVHVLCVCDIVESCAPGDPHP